jgi:hypothetical protein
MSKDMQHFADAVRQAGGDPTEVLTRGLSGAAGLPRVAELLARSNTDAGLPSGRR